VDDERRGGFLGHPRYRILQPSPKYVVNLPLALNHRHERVATGNGGTADRNTAVFGLGGVTMQREISLAYKIAFEEPLSLP